MAVGVRRPCRGASMGSRKSFVNATQFHAAAGATDCDGTPGWPMVGNGIAEAQERSRLEEMMALSEN